MTNGSRYANNSDGKKAFIVPSLTWVSDEYSLYEEFDYLMCRTKLVIKTDAKKVQRYVYPDKRGVHRTGTLGDHREEIRDLATLIGFEVIEEDK